MFREGEFPPEVATEYKKMEGEKNMSTGDKSPREIKPEYFEGSKEELVGNLQAGLMEPKDFVQEVFGREGGDPRRAAMATHSIKEFWIKQLDEGKMSPEEFEKGVYAAAARMLGERKSSPEEEEKGAIREERIKRAVGKRAA